MNPPSSEATTVVANPFASGLGTPAASSRAATALIQLANTFAVDPRTEPLSESLRQVEAFQKAFDVYAADCAKSPACPLGTDPDQFVAR